MVSTPWRKLAVIFYSLLRFGCSRYNGFWLSGDGLQVPQFAEILDVLMSLGQVEDRTRDEGMMFGFIAVVERNGTYRAFIAVFHLLTSRVSSKVWFLKLRRIIGASVIASGISM
jgi:hypothetical protein